MVPDENNTAVRKPAMVGWGITDQCNLSCAHCYSSASRTAKDELSTVEAKQVLDALGRMGTERLGWTGGEPLLRRDLEELTAYARDRHQIRAGITTNGVPLSPRRAKSLKEAGIGFIQVSLDGSTAERNKLIRGASERTFERILDGIRAAADLGFSLHIAMLLSAATIDDARDMVKLVQSLNVQSLRFCGFVPWGYARSSEIRQRHDLSGRLDEVRELVEELQTLESPLVLFDPAFGPLPPAYYYHDCLAGMELLYIGPTGDVYPCTSLLNADFCVGNVRKTPLEEIWNDPKMTMIAEYPRENITGACRECAHFSHCHGACRGIAHACTGSLDSSFVNCLAQVAVPTPKL